MRLPTPAKFHRERIAARLERLAEIQEKRTRLAQARIALRIWWNARWDAEMAIEAGERAFQRLLDERPA